MENEMKAQKKCKLNKGVTLVALVVTIVIILILAGVGIATISGENGILRKAVEAKEKTEIAGLKERIELVQQDWFIDKTLDPTVTVDDFWDKLIDEGIINSKGDVTGPEKEGDNDIYILETDDGYKVEIIVDPDGDIEIGDIGKDKDLTLKIREIEVKEKTENSITVSVNVRGTGTDEVKVSYYYKTEDEDEYHELIGGQDTTDLEATFTGLEEGTTYNIKVVATEGDKTTELVKNITTVAEIKIEDKQPPTATVTLTTTEIIEKEKITATVVQTDNQSGVNIESCKWKFTTSQDKLGTDATSYTGDMSGSFTSESENIECTANTPGTYWLHVLTVDNEGNPAETVSKTSVTVKEATISANDLANDDELFKKVAGGVVENYIDGQDIDWKVFYADDKGIYLIASDYVPASKLAEQKSTLGLSSFGTYSIFWNRTSDFKVTSIDSEVASRFMLNQLSTFDTINDNYKATACLIDTTKWNTFRDARWADENDIIGGPTLEMYVASWNKKYPLNKLYTKANSTGYYVGTSENPTTDYVDMSTTPGYSDKLYYPHQSTFEGCYNYWLTSPSAYTTISRMCINCTGNVSNTFFHYDGCGIRPLVHLKNGVKLKEVEDGKYKLVTEDEAAQLVANTPIWNASTHKASVTIGTTTNSQIQWQKGGTSGEWTTVEKGKQSVTIPDLDHNDIINARLWDGTSVKEETSVTVKDVLGPTIRVDRGTITSSSIQVTVISEDNQWGMPTNPTYNYYIKKKADANYPTTPAKAETTDTSYIFAGLDQNTAYTIKVTTTDKAGNAGEGKLGETGDEIKTGTVAGAGTDLTTGVLTASAPSWDPTEHTASITLTTTTDYQIQWQKGGIDADGWTTVEVGTKETTVSDLEHGDMVFARLYDGKNAGNEASVKVEDGDDPENATITGLPTEAISEGEKITATVVHTDNQSGVKVADCKWKFTTSQDTKLGTEATSYAGDMSGSFTSESENIECTANTAGTYWLHVLTVDNGGNAVETVSGTSVTVNQAGISAGDIANDDDAFKKVAGGKVTNYSDGQNIEWKVFYADTNGIYLIASDYVPVSKLTSQQSTLGFTTNGSYNIYWSSSSSFKVTSIDSTVANRFMLNKLSTFSTGNNNYKMTACLIDATKWNTFRDARWVDENDIIGGPTLEMYVASWNKKYPSNKLYTNANSTGYYVGTSANPTSYSVGMSGTPGYSDTLYYPHTSAWNSCNGYWLASPSAYNTNIEMYVIYNGNVNSNYYNYTNLGVRPVVHLKSGVKLKEVGADFELVQ